MSQSRYTCLLRLTLAALAMLFLVEGRVAAQSTPARMLVIPFETGDDPRTWWLGEGAAVLLVDDLRTLGIEAIGRDERLSAFARLQVPPIASLSHGTVIRIGQLVGASAVVIGTVSMHGDALTVRARSMRLDAGRLQQEVEEQGSVNALFAVFERLARRLAPAAAVPPPAAAPRNQPSPAAFENYVKGVLADTPTAQIALLRKAISLHRGYDAARLALWRAYTDAAQHDKALATALEVPAQSRLAQRARFAAGLSEIALNKYDEAFERLRALGEEAPSGAIANNLGVIQLRRAGATPRGRATYWFTRAKDLTPDADYFFNLGYAYWYEQDVQAAIYWLRETVRRNPADGDAHYVLGAALQVAGSATEAGRELELAQRLAATHQGEGWRPGERVPRGLERLHTALMPAGATPAETTLVATAERERSELVTFHLERGRRLFEAENDREAIDELRRALYLSPYLAEAHVLLGRAYLRTGRTHEAVETLKIAIWSEETAAAHEVLAEAWLQARDGEAARREAERALAMDPASEAARRVLAQLSAR
jgi:tetratricopeptide (TPR) repeat protein